MRHIVLLTEGAQQDLAEMVGFVTEKDGAVAANNMLAEMVLVLEGLTPRPERGARQAHLEELGIYGNRQVTCEPYRILYRVNSREIFVLLIGDQRRNLRENLESRLLGRRRETESAQGRQ